MPKINVNDTELYFEDSGGPGEPIVFSHGLLWNTTLFAPQVAAFKDRYRCIAYDHRGQGRSADDTRRVIDMDLLTLDAVALIEALRLGPVHFCGLSMGGFIGMRLAARHPQRVRSLILCETSAEPEPPANAPRYKRLNVAARWLGPRLVMPAVMPILFGKTALSDPSRAGERDAWRRELNKNRRSIWRAVNGVIRRADVLDELPRIVAPTLVIVGLEDVATPPAKAERIASGIAGSTLAMLQGAGHSSTVEAPQAVNAAIERFLRDVVRSAPMPSPPPANPAHRYEQCTDADVLTQLVAEAVRCSPATWTRGVLTVGCDESSCPSCDLKNEGEPGSAPISGPLRQLIEEFTVRMARRGEPFRQAVLTFRRQDGQVEFDTQFEWPPARAKAD